MAVAIAPSAAEDLPVFPQIPTVTQSDPNAVMYQPTGAAVKTATITNNLTDPIYPILEGQNSKGGEYDKNDKGINQEYRVYVGYNRRAARTTSACCPARASRSRPPGDLGLGTGRIRGGHPGDRPDFPVVGAPVELQPSAATCAGHHPGHPRRAVLLS